MRAFVLAAGFLLCGCNQIGERKEAAACRAFFESAKGISMPFSSENTHIIDKSITFDELKKSYYPGTISELEKMHLTTMKGKVLGIRSIGMNADKPELIDGVMLNGIVCDFVLNDGELYRDNTLVEDAKSAATNYSASQLADALDDPKLKKIASRRRDKSMCCIP